MTVRQVRTDHKIFTITIPYMRGAKQAQECKPAMNPYRPGPCLAQYNYGYANEQAGFHDDLELPFELLLQDDSHEFYKATKK